MDLSCINVFFGVLLSEIVIFIIFCSPLRLENREAGTKTQAGSRRAQAGGSSSRWMYYVAGLSNSGAGSCSLRSFWCTGRGLSYCKWNPHCPPLPYVTWREPYPPGSLLIVSHLSLSSKPSLPFSSSSNCGKIARWCGQKGVGQNL